MTLFDLIAIIVVLLSVLAGFSNGAVRELVGLCAFGLAVVGAVLLLPFTGQLARAVVQPSWASSAVAVVAAFLLIYIVLQVGGRFLTSRLRDSGILGGIDQTLGGGIGLVRAGVLLGAFYLVYQAATPPALRPAWIDHAALFPAAGAAGRTLQSIAPDGMAAAGRLAPSLKQAMTSPPEAEQAAGITLGADRARNGVQVESDSAERAAPRPRAKTGVASRRPPRDGLDVVLEPSR